MRDSHAKETKSLSTVNQRSATHSCGLLFFITGLTRIPANIHCLLVRLLAEYTPGDPAMHMSHVHVQVPSPWPSSLSHTHSSAPWLTSTCTREEARTSTSRTSDASDRAQPPNRSGSAEIVSLTLLSPLSHPFSFLLSFPLSPLLSLHSLLSLLSLLSISPHMQKYTRAHERTDKASPSTRAKNGNMPGYRRLHQ